MKKIISLLLALLILPSVEPLGFGMIVNMNFGEVVKGEEYIKELMTWAYDQNYYPYTNDTFTYNITVVITNGDDYVTHADEIISQANRWSYTDIVLFIPKKAKKGDYLSQICAVAMYSEFGGMFNIGACQNIIYSIVSKGQAKQERK